MSALVIDDVPQTNEETHETHDSATCSHHTNIKSGFLLPIIFVITNRPSIARKSNQAPSKEEGNHETTSPFSFV